MELRVRRFVVRSPLTCSEVTGGWFDPISVVNPHAALTNINKHVIEDRRTLIGHLQTRKFRPDRVLLLSSKLPTYTYRKSALLNTQDKAVAFRQKPKGLAQGIYLSNRKEEGLIDTPKVYALFAQSIKGHHGSFQEEGRSLD